MSAKNTQNETPAEAIKNPTDWVTGDEPMTGAQESYVNTLARQAGEDVPDEMTKAEASQKIEELPEKTGKAPAKARAKARSPRKPRKKAG